MKILIAADMEGITGVVHWDQVNPSHPEYPRFRRLMTADVNAAIRGAFAAGADEVIVSDGHNNGRNILIEELDPRARLNSGSPSPLSMVEGVQDSVNGVMFVGYHARIGTPYAILEHTWSDERVWGLQLNDEPCGEIRLNAALSGHYGAPVIMISGDRAACLEAQALLGGIEMVVVKQASGRFAAECLSPAHTGKLIEEAARRAVARLERGDAPAAYKVHTPLTFSIEFVQSEMADRAAFLPNSERQGRRLTLPAADMPEMLRLFRAALSLARG